MTGLLALMGFLLVAAPYHDGHIATDYFSGQGIFTAILTAIYTTEVYALLKRKTSLSACRKRCRPAWRARLKFLSR